MEGGGGTGGAGGLDRIQLTKARARGLQRLQVALQVVVLMNCYMILTVNAKQCL